MTLKHFLGYLILSSPFVGLFIYYCITDGWVETATLFVCMGIAVAILSLGAYLVES